MEALSGVALIDCLILCTLALGLETDVLIGCDEAVEKLKEVVRSVRFLDWVSSSLLIICCCCCGCFVAHLGCGLHDVNSIMPIDSYRCYPAGSTTLSFPSSGSIKHQFGLPSKYKYSVTCKALHAQRCK